MFKQNLGKVDRILRFALAFWWLSPMAPYFYTDWLNTVVAVVAWIALAESFAGFCWLHGVLRINNINQ